MPTQIPITAMDFVRLVRTSRAVDTPRLSVFLKDHPVVGLPTAPDEFADHMVRAGLLSDFQAELLLLGRPDGLTLGRYRVIDLLGRGGMGSVFLAEDGELRRKVAVKVQPAADAHPTVRERFLREARAAAAVSHPHVVRAFDYGAADGVLYLVMEYIPGTDLQKLVWGHGPLPVGLACEYLRQAALGLHAVHAAGLVHRDIKPSNLMVDAHGTVRLLDLGLVRDIGPDGGGLTVAQGAGFVGTLEYVAPEQMARPDPPDPRSDIFGLGACLLFLLTGRHPRDTTDGRLAPRAVLAGELPRLADRRPDVPPGLDALCAEMTVPDPAARPATAAVVASRLIPFADASIALPAAKPKADGSPAGTPDTPLANTPMAVTQRLPGRRWRLTAGLAAAAAGWLLLLLLTVPWAGVQPVTEVPARPGPRLWVTGELPAPDHPRAVGLSADGTVGLAVGRNREYQLYALPAGTPGRRYTGSPGLPSAAALAPNGRRLLWVTNDTTAVLTDLATDTEVGRLTGDPRLTVVALSDDWAAAGTSAGSLYSWRPATGERHTASFPFAPVIGGPIAAMTFASGGHLAVIRTDGQMVQLHPPDQLRRLTTAATGTAAGPPGSLAAAADRLVVTDTTRLAVVRVGPPMKLLRHVPDAEAAQQTTAFAVTASGRWAVAGYDGGVRVWDLDTAADRFDLALPGELTISVALSADGSIGLVGLASGKVLCVRLAGLD